MAKKKIEVYIEISTDKEFDSVLYKHKGGIICAEVYSAFSGSCDALYHLLKNLKLVWSDGQFVILRVLADEIERLKRFRNRSEPTHLFMTGNKVTRVVRGVHAVEFRKIAIEELKLFRAEHSGESSVQRNKYDIHEPTPEEVEWQLNLEAERAANAAELQNRRAARQTQRKEYRALQLAKVLKQLNFVLFWPHAKHAHPELYQRWNDNDIIMVGREELQLTPELAKDILYASDSPENEAAARALLAGEALAICFRILDKDRDFVALVRHILYEYIPSLDEKKPQRDQPVQKTAFEHYSSYSMTKEEIKQQRSEQRAREKEERRLSRARRKSEMLRLNLEALAEETRLKKLEKEAQILARLKAGDLKALDEADAEDEDQAAEVAEERKEIGEEIQLEESSSSSDDGENEDLPPAGLLVPGLYSPPNEIAKANALAILFPNIVSALVEPPPEFLPPHVLVFLPIDKRYKALEILGEYKTYVLHLGIFRADVPFRPPYPAQHLTYTIKQYDNVFRTPCLDAKLALMLSARRSLPLLLLMDLNPLHVSLDEVVGEEECAAIFPVGYGEEQSQFEDFEQFVST